MFDSILLNITPAVCGDADAGLVEIRGRDAITGAPQAILIPVEELVTAGD